MSYFDAEGNEVEGLLTSEEVEAKLAAEREQLARQVEEAKAQAEQRVIDLESDRKIALEKLRAYEAQSQSAGEGGGDKDVNLANLRKKLEDTTSALEEERKLNAERFTGLLNERVEQEINAFARGDAELAKKVRFNYDNVLVGLKANTQEEIRTKVANAFKLAAPINEGPDMLSTAIGGGNRGYSAPTPVGAAKKFTPKEIAAGNLLGITDQDRAKYSTDPRLKH